ncbi:MAG: metallophosphoesterase [Candidatus Micrarchaeota archaeon]
MRLLALTDMHGEEIVLEKITPVLKKKYDYILVLGDITHKGPPSFADSFLSLLPKNTLALRGNMDPDDVAQLIETRGVSLHARRVEAGRFNFVGFGGSNPTPFGTPREFTEDEIYSALSALNIDANTILVTHAPPFDTPFDLVGGGAHVGSKSIRKIIDERQPLLNLCGHIHEHEGEVEIGKTKIVKVAPASEGKGAEISITARKIEVRFIRF